MYIFQDKKDSSSQKYLWEMNSVLRGTYIEKRMMQTMSLSLILKHFVISLELRHSL